MSWVCPHQINNECSRLKKSCEPSQKGCIIGGGATFISYEEAEKNKDTFVPKRRKTGRPSRS
ncbi:MAG: hypothetical protein ACUBOA_13420 [Candidatus Loosdrechtia sp.]|uniref:hypothetical protein n=1 Tax=Candidatus Loosdrechtia sp. TaxID=3101272 RepID=UPI00403A8B3D